MCGIIGFNFKNKKLLNKIIKEIKHRGPDADGTHTNELISLGHTRLSILDLSKKANQPFKYKNLIIIFNGEIYNFKEIREELIIKKYKFTTESDTEVICAAYLEWKEKCLNKFNGMFSFSIYNQKTQELFLARDRFGIKPLYYTTTKDKYKKFAFCSELRPLKNIVQKVEINKKAIEEYFHLRFTISEESVIKNIFKFKPGHYMIYDLKNKKIKEYKSYYKLIVKQNNKIKYNFAKNKLKELMHKSIKYRMVSDVPVSCFLSGGLDSSIISTLVSKENQKLNTFSIGFETTNELNHAKKVSKRINSKHRQFETNQKVLRKYIDKMIKHIDEPIGDPGFLPILYLSKEVKKHNKVVLSGDGADEIFCGYDRYKLFQYGKYLKHLPIPNLNEITNRLKKMKKSKNEGEEFFEIIRLFDDDELKKLKIKNIKKDILKQNYVKNKKNNSRLNNAMLFDIKTLMPNDFFMKADKMSSAFGLEQRVPFMDHNIIEFAFSLPNKFKLSLLNEKKILKDTFNSELPKSTIKRKKHGFNVPIDYWFQNELGSELKKLLINSKYNLYNKKYIVNLLESIKKNRIEKNSLNVANNFIIAQKLWSIYVLEKWLTKL